MFEEFLQEIEEYRQTTLLLKIVIQGHRIKSAFWMRSVKSKNIWGWRQSSSNRSECH